MSYSNLTDLKNVINKNVFFIDLETIGLVKNTGFDCETEKNYPDYKSNIYYNEARIIQIGWLYLKDFDYTYEILPKNINDKIIKPNKFEIKNSNIHGITNEYALKNGYKIKTILKKIEKNIIECDYIFGYNIFFDIAILLNEMHRSKMYECIYKILDLIENKKIICIGVLSSLYAKPRGWTKYYKYQIPKQIQVYENCFNKKIQNLHNAKFDTCSMIDIMFWIYNKNN